MGSFPTLKTHRCHPRVKSSESLWHPSKSAVDSYGFPYLPHLLSPTSDASPSDEKSSKVDDFCFHVDKNLPKDGKQADLFGANVERRFSERCEVKPLDFLGVFKKSNFFQIYSYRFPICRSPQVVFATAWLATDNVFVVGAAKSASFHRRGWWSNVGKSGMMQMM